MRLLTSVLLFYSSIFLISCSNCKDTQSGNQSNQNFQTSITQNLSVVEAEVLEINGSCSDFKLKARILKSQETEAFPSIAVAGEEYVLIPNILIDNGKLI